MAVVGHEIEVAVLIETFGNQWYRATIIVLVNS